MEVVSVPIILIICYMMAEVFKVIFKNKSRLRDTYHKAGRIAQERPF